MNGAVHQETRMWQGCITWRGRFFLAAICLAVAAVATPERASAQVYYYQCPYGYAYLEGYDC